MLCIFTDVSTEIITHLRLAKPFYIQCYTVTTTTLSGKIRNYFDISFFFLVTHNLMNPVLHKNIDIYVSYGICFSDIACFIVEIQQTFKNIYTFSLNGYQELIVIMYHCSSVFFFGLSLCLIRLITAAVAQSVKAFASHAVGWRIESQPRQT